MNFSSIASFPKWLFIGIFIALNEIFDTLVWLLTEVLFQKGLVQILLFFNIGGNFFTQRVQLESGIAIGNRWFGYTKFSNIRYATAKRFKAPEKLPSSPSRILNLRETYFPQEFSPVGLDRFPLIRVIGENLYENYRKGFLGSEEEGHQLDIWTPTPTPTSNNSSSSTNGLKPVLFLLHGGTFISSSKSQSFIDGTTWAKKHGYVVVSANYRLGILGFLIHPDANDEDITPNCGMLDQICALRWVKENIHKFGGDPNRVTCAGQSAGAMSVSTLASIREVIDEKLFHKTVLLSGGPHLHLSPRLYTRVYYETAFALKFITEKTDKLMVLSEEDQAKFDHKGFAKLLNSLTTQQLIVAASKVQKRCSADYFKSERCHLPAYAPSLDWKLFFKNPVRQMKDNGGNFPTFSGSTNSEWTFFGLIEEMIAKNKKNMPDDAQRLAKRIQGWFTEPHGECQVSEQQIKDIVDAYLKKGAMSKRMSKVKSPQWMSFNGDFLFRLGNEEYIDSMPKATPCFVFILSNPGLFESIDVPHVGDLPYFFDKLRCTQPLVGLWTPKRVALKNKMMDDLDNFMKGEYEKLWQPWSAEKRPTFFYDTRQPSDDHHTKGYFSGLVFDVDSTEMRAWKPLLSRFLDCLEPSSPLVQ